MVEQTPDDTRARNRYLVINAVRFGGVIMILIGLAIANDVWDLPDMLAYALIILGMTEVFFIPFFLSKRWSTKSES